MSNDHHDEPFRNPTPAAFFDVDGTISSTDVVRTYLDFWLGKKPIHIKLFRFIKFLPKIPYYAILDALSRAWFGRVFYKNYSGVKESSLRSWAQTALYEYWQPRLFPQAIERIQQHRAKGHLVVLISGGLQLTLVPLARFLNVDTLIAAEARIQDGFLTGNLVDGPMSGERKAESVRKLSVDLNVDLGKSYAYSDSYSDVAFLESIRYPVTVNPDRKLAKLAYSREWAIERWSLD